jgi:glycosyltransferase involved in cell wall biosynthesis
VRVHVVDPSAYTPPYDHALCCALAALDTEVDLFTSRFVYGPVAQPDGYARHEFFYQAAFGTPAGRARRVSKLIQHVPDMLRYRSAARQADVVHFQWLAVQHLDRYLLPAGRTRDGCRRPLVLTAHDVLPREPRAGQLRAQLRLYDRFDAIVVHSEHGRSRLVGELGVDGERVHVIPHGIFAHLAEGEDALLPGEGAEPPSGGRYASVPVSEQAGHPASPEALPEGDVLSQRGAPCARAHAHAGHPPQSTTTPAERPPRGNNLVVLMFGLMRPYKGIDILLEAWRGVDGQAPIEDAQLWLVGMPKMDISPLQATAPANVYFEPRFVADTELPAYFKRADLVVLPYRQADQSGVLFTALAFGKPLLLSDVGGFPEIADTGAARVVPAGNARALGRALRELAADRATLAKMCVKARAAATGRYSWPAIAAAHLELYRSL